MNHWLMKSEPDTFGIDDLARRPNQTEHWDGVRNYQARNMLRDEMRPGDFAFFYHSNCKTPGIAGIAEIVSHGYPDHTAYDPDNDHYDPGADPARPRWYMVDVRYVRHMRRIISLDEMRRHVALSEMPLLRRGNRLSITPVTPDQWAFILSIE